MRHPFSLAEASTQQPHCPPAPLRNRPPAGSTHPVVVEADDGATLFDWLGLLLGVGGFCAVALIAVALGAK